MLAPATAPTRLSLIQVLLFFTQYPNSTIFVCNLGGVHIGDVLIDTGSDGNLVTKSLLRDLYSRGVEFDITPFHYPKFSNGIGGQERILGICRLNVSPGSTPGVKKKLPFYIVEHCPRPVILGMPTILAFHMDILASFHKLRYFYYAPTLKGRKVKAYETPLKVIATGFTYKSKSPYIRIVLAKQAQFYPDYGTTVWCVFDRLPDVPSANYTVLPRQDFTDFDAERTVYSHADLFANGMQAVLGSTTVPFIGVDPLRMYY
ncbi:hypothetical protein BC829DRAFT_470000 [Chytridium lagenaria]|nr:hypothetical protein BC829DRAFT_470000 [Chytridium lagenaria]